MGPSTKCKYRTFVQKYEKLLNNKILSSAYFLCSCICTTLHQISVEKHQLKNKMKNFKTVTGTELKQRIKICKSIQVRFPKGWVYSWERGSERDRDRERERDQEMERKTEMRRNEEGGSWLRYSLLHNVKPHLSIWCFNIARVFCYQWQFTGEKDIKLNLTSSILSSSCNSSTV